MKQCTLPLNLQYFAAEPETGEGNGQTQGNAAQSNAEQHTTPSFDYDKLASIISGKQSVAEETVLKNYFKQQGLSKEEMDHAISSFKAEKAKNQPDVNGLQAQLGTAQKMAQQAVIEKEAVLEAVALGVDAKTVPYLIKLADMSEVLGADGKVNHETLKNALNKVLEDVPQLKPQKEENKGFQIGGGSSPGQNNTSQDALKKAFGL